MLYIYDSFARSLAHRPEAPDDEFVVRSDLFNFERVVMGEGDCRGVVGDLHLQLVPSPSGQPEDDALSKKRMAPKTSKMVLTPKRASTRSRTRLRGRIRPRTLGSSSGRDPRLGNTRAL